MFCYSGYVNDISWIYNIVECMVYKWNFGFYGVLGMWVFVNIIGEILKVNFKCVIVKFN